MGLIGAAIPVLAHHAFTAEFDAAQPIKLQGTVMKVELIYSHSWFHIDVKRPNGTVESWMIEAGPPNALFRRGFDRNPLPLGTEIVVTGYRAKDGNARANGRDITFSDGRRLFVDSAGTAGAGGQFIGASAQAQRVAAVTQAQTVIRSNSRGLPESRKNTARLAGGGFALGVLATSAGR